ncbi:MAG: cysteine desulfurase family protein [Bacillota bacterium]
MPPAEVYLDNSATTPVFPEVIAAMEKVMREEYGNPSSLHRRGSGADRMMEMARQTIAELLCVSSEEIIFTSGGTESNNLAIMGIARRNRRRGDHLVTTLIEHSSILEPFQQLEKEGFRVTYLLPDERGLVDPAKAVAAVNSDTILVSIMHVNNEIGSLQPVSRLASAIKARNPRLFFHVDAVQSFGKLPLHPGEAGIDALSISAHKFHGPRGMGALFLRRGIHIDPLLYGGGHERGLRAGTENTPGVVGMALAARLSCRDQQQKINKLASLKERMLAAVEPVNPWLKVNGPRGGEEAAPHILNISFPGLKGELILHALEEHKVYISTGSACHSNKKGPSHVLQALRLDERSMEGAIRISLSEQNTAEQIDYAATALNKVIAELS